VFEKNRELLNQLGSTVIYLGKPGSGHKMKLILNLHLGSIGLAFSEALVLSQKLALNLESSLMLSTRQFRRATSRN